MVEQTAKPVAQDGKCRGTCFPDLLVPKQTKFVLWLPRFTDPAPRLVIGTFQPGNPPALASRRTHDLEEVPGHAGLWGIEVADCGLIDQQVYHYWFEVADSHPSSDGGRKLCTDPRAFTVDWRLLSEPQTSSSNSRTPATVVKFSGGKLVGCEAAGEDFVSVSQADPQGSAVNARLVVYELPTSWTRLNQHGDVEVGVGTFRDVAALVDEGSGPANCAGVAALDRGRSHLGALGVNALELLPPADSFVSREWGYATSNYLAPDFDLGLPAHNTSPTPNLDLATGPMPILRQRGTADSATERNCGQPD
jgi:pullulanase